MMGDGVTEDIAVDILAGVNWNVDQAVETFFS
jgi:hypothetical protein